ncbi:CBS domain-containing protein [Gammaproteobacteria bacterium]|jgi:magnesium and cobalt transporter|nr:CBS domain-containing protein [Gammaproteobacteria bacterium]MDB3994695.1 CBS domain-containing protein [Gammaproteobacteria bacterium]MDB4815870.1 CBS domain-containing protein [Gammaproteobacteria bacterium]MDC0509093.1 CBS domain-containing protein [Gammaproteobacteria bacterium]MDC0545247.1 CBS domain-containing protein [Gammaproteobacteria bacterium]|tara:strand:- start:1314 stop:2183 length:870 start_codon:yes stop_codon:yes gene_type:complete
MNDEPPSISAESSRLGFRKRIKDKIKEIYQNFSYKPQNKQELAGSIRDSSERGVLEKGTLNMIEGALRVSTDQVRDIMIPRPQVVFVDKNEKPADFLPRVVKSSHSRFPVINSETEKIEGILLAKDLLPFLSSKDLDEFELSQLIRPAILIPESKKLNILLDELRAGRNHMAIVLDEYGDVTGIVTIEDVLEEIVGEIEDEHDKDSGTLIKEIGEDEYLVSALTPIDVFNETFNSSLSDKDFDTLGGIVMHHFARFPKPNDAINIDGLRFVINSLERRRIKRIKVSKIN